MESCESNPNQMFDAYNKGICATCKQPINPSLTKNLHTETINETRDIRTQQDAAFLKCQQEDKEKQQEKDRKEMEIKRKLEEESKEIAEKQDFKSKVNDYINTHQLQTLPDSNGSNENSVKIKIKGSEVYSNYMKEFQFNINGSVTELFNHIIVTADIEGSFQIRNSSSKGILHVTPKQFLTYMKIDTIGYEEPLTFKNAGITAAEVMYLETSDKFTTVNQQSSGKGETTNATSRIIENGDLESSEDGVKNDDALKPKDACLKEQALAVEMDDTALEAGMEAANTENNPQLSGNTTHENSEDKSTEEQCNLQIDGRTDQIHLQAGEIIAKDAEFHLAEESRNGGMVASDKMEGVESNPQEVGPETQISEVEPGIIIPVSSENLHENQYTKARMMNDAISVGKSFLKSSFGVAGTIFTGIGSVLTTAAKIVGEKNVESVSNNTTNIQNTNIQNNVQILVLQNNAEEGKIYNAKNRRNQRKKIKWMDQPCKNEDRCKFKRRNACMFNH